MVLERSFLLRVVPLRSYIEYQSLKFCIFFRILSLRLQALGIKKVYTISLNTRELPIIDFRQSRTIGRKEEGESYGLSSLINFRCCSFTLPPIRNFFCCIKYAELTNIIPASNRFRDSSGKSSSRLGALWCLRKEFYDDYWMSGPERRFFRRSFSMGK